jgi:phospholipid/cholesterol/gamma-HCH transport system ATP-binding protein
MIELQHIHKSFDSVSILNNINLRVENKETVVICGPGGCGKTTLLKVCQGLVQPDSGNVILNGSNIGMLSQTEFMNIRKNIGMLFQNYALFDSMTVGQNIGFFLSNHTDMDDISIRKAVEESLEMVHLEGSYNLMPSELSGGMRKRVGIARALIHKPRIVFYDSPTDGLDPVTADAIVDSIIAINQASGVTSLVVSNDMNTAFRLADRVAFLYESSFHALGSTEHIINSEDPHVYQFIRGLGEGPLYSADTL